MICKYLLAFIACKVNFYFAAGNKPKERTFTKNQLGWLPHGKRFWQDTLNLQAGITWHIDDEIENWRKKRNTKSLTFKLKRNMFWIDPNLSSAVKYLKPQRVYSNESHESESLHNMAGQKDKKNKPKDRGLSQ